MQKKTQLALGVATAAIITGLATPANAACTVDGSTVTCTADSTATEVNAALAGVAGNDVTLEFVDDALVTQPFSQIFPTQQGQVAIDNAGAIGTEDAPVGIGYFGTADDADNTFSLDNSGSITGNVSVQNVGGEVALTNSGLLAGGVFVNVTGPATLISTEQIDGFGSPAVYLGSRTSAEAVIEGDVGTAATATDDSDLRDIVVQSQVFVSQPFTSDTETEDGVTTTTTSSGFTYEGGSASVVIDEEANTGSVRAVGLENASVSIDGSVGSLTQYDSARANSDVTARSTVSVSTSDGTNSTYDETTTQTALGGDASVAVGETGSVSGDVQANGLNSATVIIDGSVGNETFIGAAFATSFGTDRVDTFSSESDGTAFSNTSSQQSSSSGGDASITIGDTGSVRGDVGALGNDDASVSNEGVVTGSINANASGSDTLSQSSSSSDGAGSSASASSSTSERTGGTASIDNAESGLIGLDATSPVLVSAFGHTASSVTNAGRINGDVRVLSNATNFASAQTSSSDSDTDDDGVTTTVDRTTNSNSSTSVGGDASFANAEGGRVTGSITVLGGSSANYVNEGAVIGMTNVESIRTDSTFAETRTDTFANTPGPEGGFVRTIERDSEQSSTSSGGDVTGLYAGTNGAVQFAPFGGASDGSVTQVSRGGNSAATVTGTIFGSFYGEATGSEITSSFSEDTTLQFDADGDIRRFESDTSSTDTNDQTENDSSLIVDGGRITQDARLYATGDATAVIDNGGIVEGSLTATSQGFGGSENSNSSSQLVIYDEDGNFTSNDFVSTSSNARSVADGDVAVTIGEGEVGGSVFLNGSGGNNSFVLGADGAVGGSVVQSSQTSSFMSESTFSLSSSPTGSSSTNDYSQTSTAAGGNVTAYVAGTIGAGEEGPLGYGDVATSGGGSLFLATTAGNADAVLTGQVRGSVSVFAAGDDSSFASQQTEVNGTTVARSSQSTSTATGGTASLTVDAEDRDVPANFGDITVIGRDGSSVVIGEDSTVLAATNGAFLQVGDVFYDSASSSDETDFIGGTPDTVTGTSEEMGTGGPASLVNDGRIGFDGGAEFDGTNASVSVVSATDASAVNNGQIFGSLSASSFYENTSSLTTETDRNDVTRVNTTTTTYAATGGSASIANNGLVTGNASLEALDGTLVNNGVIRGDIELGRSVDNYTTQSVDTLTQLGEEEVLDLAEAIEQGYAVEQNGLVGGTISVAGVFGQLDDREQTSAITADIALNSGSVTGGGVFAEYDEETGERFTATNVTLNGAGFLGLGNVALAQLETAFGDADPGIVAAGDLSAYAGGARVLGVETLTKTGDGVFLITGAPFAPMTNTNTVADYTLDLGTFAIDGGEIQLATAGSDAVFGIRGDIVNSAGLVLGNRIDLPAPLFGTNASVNAIDGVEVYQNGDFVQTGSGTLSVGVMPTLVRVVDPAFSSISVSTNPLAVQSIGLASGLFTTPENAFGQAFTELGMGFLTVDGDMDLAGTVELVSPTGGLFTNGQTVDIASVSGTVTTSAGVDVNSSSNFVSFDLDTRSEGGRTIVFASADRAGFETAGNNQNAIAAGSALSDAFDDVVTAIQAGTAGGIGIAGDRFVLAQDLANIFVGFDTLLTMDQVGTALNELASGEFYGSLTTLETTAPFVDAISSRRVPDGASGFNVWLAPSGDFVDLEGDSAVGSRDIEADNYGGSVGFGIATDNGEIGAGVGYGRISANADNDLLMAEADTWMLGAYLRQGFSNFAISADLVYGWSDWNASRVMPTLSRTAFSEFDSTELRGDLRAEYMVDFGNGWVAPFGQLTFRQFDFDGFTEDGAGAVNLVVEDADETVLTPTLGLRAGTRFETGLATLRPELTLAYSFDDDNASFRNVAYLGAPTNSFRLQGVDPDLYFTIGAGLFADIGVNSGAFLRASYATGSNVDVTSVNAGVTIGF
ncbi:autotransporter domain-containing protein [Altererythrobacter sp. MTPC7]|uniref:autotransporter domain-containing protein n=1 Tax=Altererythrobacter sp. MTPC7 TaxID=3056567 RepID=UPI0036F3F922